MLWIYSNLVIIHKHHKYTVHKYTVNKYLWLIFLIALSFMLFDGINRARSKLDDISSLLYRDAHPAAGERSSFIYKHWAVLFQCVLFIVMVLNL